MHQLDNPPITHRPISCFGLSHSRLDFCQIDKRAIWNADPRQDFAAVLALGGRLETPSPFPKLALHYILRKLRSPHAKPFFWCRREMVARQMTLVTRPRPLCLFESADKLSRRSRAVRIHRLVLPDADERLPQAQRGQVRRVRRASDMFRIQQ